MENTARKITSVIPTENLCVTKSTAVWINKLYESGAVSFNQDRSALLDEEIRNLVRAIHVVLSGGEVKIEISQSGSFIYDQLEKAFQKSWDDSNIANEFCRIDGSAMMMP